MAKGTSTATDLASRFKAATSVPATPAPARKRAASKKRAAAPATTPAEAPADTTAEAPAEAPARQPRRVPNRRPEAPSATVEDRFPRRIALYISESMLRELKMAQLEDGIEMSARVRGALEYWMEGRPQPDPETGEMTKPGRQTAAIDLRARRLSGR